MEPLSKLVAGLAALLVATGAAYLVIGAPEPTPTAAVPAVVGPTPPTEADSDTGYVPGTLPDGTRPAVQVAVDVLPLALGYDYRTLDEGLDQATALMTDDFAQEFRRTFAATAAEQAEQQDAVTSANVRSAGVVRVEGADGRRVLCLVYVDQVLVSDQTTKDPDNPLRISQNRVLVGVTDDTGSGDWLVDSITPI